MTQGGSDKWLESEILEFSEEEFNWFLERLNKPPEVKAGLKRLFENKIFDEQLEVLDATMAPLSDK